MRGHGWYEPAAMATRIVLVEATYENGDRTVLVPTDVDGYGITWERKRVAPGVEAPAAFSLSDDAAEAVLEALEEARGKPSSDERIAALEAEVRLLREWLAAERERSVHPPMTITPPTLDCKKVEAIIEEFRRERPSR